MIRKVYFKNIFEEITGNNNFSAHNRKIFLHAGDKHMVYKAACMLGGMDLLWVCIMMSLHTGEWEGQTTVYNVWSSWDGRMRLGGRGCRE